MGSNNRAAKDLRNIQHRRDVNSLKYADVALSNKIFYSLCDKPNLNIKQHIMCICKFTLTMWYTFPESSTVGVWILSRVVYYKMTEIKCFK